ncbi:MAG TPA: hypothetical protein VKC56_00755 [Gallionellaceae bacterium]|nr:hypothetical protein [Gallionellaceae bacterium]
MSAQATRKAPAGVKVVAWLYIVSGALSLMMVAAGVLFDSALSQLPAMDADISPELAQMAASRARFGAPDVYELVFAALALWCGIALLRLKPWARAATEWLTWATLASTVAFGVYYVHLWRAISAELAQNIGAAANLPMLQTVGTVTGIVLTLLFCAPWIAAIRYLRGSAARAALAPPRGPAAAR